MFARWFGSLKLQAAASFRRYVLVSIAGAAAFFFLIGAVSYFVSALHTTLLWYYTSLQADCLVGGAFLLLAFLALCCAWGLSRGARKKLPSSVATSSVGLPYAELFRWILSLGQNLRNLQIWPSTPRKTRRLLLAVSTLLILGEVLSRLSKAREE